MTENQKKERIKGYSRIEFSSDAIRLLQLSKRYFKNYLLIITQSISAHPGNFLKIYDYRETILEKAKHLGVSSNFLEIPKESILSELREILNQPGVVSIKENRKTPYVVIKDFYSTGEPPYLFSVKTFPGKVSIKEKERNAYWCFISLSRDEKAEKNGMTIVSLTDKSHFLIIKSIGQEKITLINDEIKVFPFLKPKLPGIFFIK